MTSVQGAGPSGGSSVALGGSNGQNGKTNGNGKSSVIGQGKPPWPYAIKPQGLLNIVVGPGVELPAGRRKATTAGNAALSGLYLGQLVLHEAVSDLGPLAWFDGQFLVYSQGAFRPISQTVLRERVITLEGQSLSRSPKDNRRIFLSQRLIGEAVACMRDMLSGPSQALFKNARPGVAFQDVFVEFADGRLAIKPHTPLHGARLWVDTTYDPAGRCPRFTKYINEVLRPIVHGDATDDLSAAWAKIGDWHTKKRLLWEWLGVALLGKACQLGKALLLWGYGGTGKSSLLEIISALWPQDLVSAVPLHSLERPYDRAMLAGKMLNVCGELPSADADVVEAAKAVITGKDLIHARNPYERPFSFVPRAAHVMAANLLPFVGDFSGAFFERFVILELVQKFRGATNENPLLAQQIIDTELGGIASAALQAGATALARGSYALPASSTTVVTRWQNMSSSVRAWLDAACLPASASGEGTYGGELYDAYRVWAAYYGFRLVGLPRFGEHLRAAGFFSSRNKRGSLWDIVLRDPTVVLSGTADVYDHAHGGPETSGKSLGFRVTMPGPEQDGP